MWLVLKGEQDMKFKKLILTTTLLLALGVSACGNQPTTPTTSETPGTSETPSTSSSSETPLVSRIKIDAPASIIVGQPVNLDDYVNVEGGEGPKVYEVTVPTAQAEKVTVEGHTLTALVEGEISVTITAGAKTAKVTTNAMSALKASWANLTGGLTTEWALHEVLETGALNPNSVVHRNDYTLFDGWTTDEKTGNYLKGGFLLAQNGNTYQYYIDASGAIQVDSTIQSSFGNYYCNMPWCLSTSDFELKTTTLEDGSEYEYLSMSYEVPCVQYSNQFSSQIEFFMYTCAIALNSSYFWSELIAEPVSLQNSDGSLYETFMLTAVVNKTATGDVAGTFSYVVETRNEVSENATVREYIDGGNAPEAVSAQPLVDAFQIVAELNNYTIQACTGWYSTKHTELTSNSAQRIADPLDETFPATYHNYFTAGQEITQVDSTGVKQTVWGTNVVGVTIESSLPLITGFKYDGDKAYTYTNGVEAEGLITPTETFTGGEAPVTPAQVKANYTLAPLADVTADDVTVLGLQEAEGLAAYTIDSAPTAAAVCGASYLAFYAYYLLGNGWTTDMTSYLDCTTYIMEGTLLFTFSLAWDNGQYYNMAIAVTALGSTTITHPTWAE